MKFLITGISSGVGRELTRQAIGAGHEVWGVARRAALLDSLQAELASERLRAGVCDVSCGAQVEAVCREMNASFIPDVVVLNAAVDIEDGAGGLSMEAVEAMLRTNVEGALAWVSAWLPEFLSRGEGQFIAVSSLFACWPDPASVSYAAGKSALSMAFRGLRLRHAGSGIAFKILYLGPLATDINPRFREEGGGGKPPPWIASPARAARRLHTMVPRRRGNCYFPFYVLPLCLVSSLVPDRLFSAMTSPFRR